MSDHRSGCGRGHGEGREEATAFATDLVLSVSVLNVFFFLFSTSPKGGRGCLMSPLCLESESCHLIPLCCLLYCSSAKSCYPFYLVFFCLLVLSSELFPENSSIFFVKRYAFMYGSCFGEVSWSVVCALCCHMTLVFAVMLLYNILEFFIASVHSFFILFF